MRRIQLDTNYLIEIHVEKSKSRAILKSLLKEKVEFSISSIAWHEFLCGPLDREQKDNILDLVQNRIISLTSEMAEEASELFNLIGRKRGMKADCLIAATCICENSEFLSWNVDDFKKFKPFGLLLF